MRLFKRYDYSQYSKMILITLLLFNYRRNGPNLAMKTFSYMNQSPLLYPVKLSSKHFSEFLITEEICT